MPDRAALLALVQAATPPAVWPRGQHERAMLIKRLERAAERLTARDVLVALARVVEGR